MHIKNQSPQFHRFESISPTFIDIILELDEGTQGR